MFVQVKRSRHRSRQRDRAGAATGAATDQGEIMSHAEMTFWAILTASGAGLWYAVHCALWPFVDCSKCEGTGRRNSPSGKAYGLCRKCKGTPRRVRVGRRFWTWINDRKNDAVG